MADDRLYYRRRSGRGIDIAVVRVDPETGTRRSNPRTVRRGLSRGTSFDVSQDASRLVYSSGPNQANVHLMRFQRAGGGWDVVDEHHLEKEYRFGNFRDALTFTNQVGELAEEVNHHPEIFLTWGRVGVKLWTHKIDGLTESDFVWAAKADRLPGAAA